MLEILVIIGLSRKIAATCKEKGRSAVGWIVMFIGLWFGGEVIGAVIGTIGGLATSGGEEPGFLIPWICGLVGAACGAAIAFAIINGLPSLQQDEYGQLPASEAYHEKFDATRYRGQGDDAAYRPKVNGANGQEGTEDATYRSAPKEV
jgi:uncharacterized membrane protein YeaQ/YmgE (transglycosylase-associated protein family)